MIADVMNYSAILQVPKNKTSREISQLVEQMRGPEGLSIRESQISLNPVPELLCRQ